MADFAHLRVHSTFSLSEGASKVDTLVERARAVGVAAVALTDRDNLFAAMVFSKTASGSGVQPIVGCQLYMSYGEGKRGNVALLAQDAQGYANLCALLRSVSDPRPGKGGEMVTPDEPVLDPETLRERSAGLILLTGGGTDGLLPSLAAKPGPQAGELYKWLLSVFGDRLYVEICRSGPPDEAQARVEDALIALAEGGAGPVACDDGTTRSEAPLVATSDVWYATPDRHDAWKLLGAVVNKETITMDGDAIVGAGEACHHMRSPSEMLELFSDLPEAYDNAANVARRCAFMVKGRDPILPAFPTEGGRTEAEELREQARAGLEARLAKAGLSGEAAAGHWERLRFELDVIEKMGFPGYFLIVSDFIKWAKAHDIPVGPGRGSGAGSIVAWALTITDLDPLEFGLLFERFLNPERVSMPDFDIDFCQDRREEVRDYVRDKYGADRVGLIATFGVIKSKTALKDMQRVLLHQQFGHVTYGEINDLTKLIPGKPDTPAEPMGLKQAFEESPEFEAAISDSPKMRMVYDQARKVEGLMRTSGAHAAGVVIVDRPLDALFPVTYDPKTGMPVVGFDMKGVETAGGVKFDFLGLTNLSVMQLCVEYIKEFRGEALDLSAIPRDDAEVYARLADGQCTGVFQFEGGGMRKVMRQVRPTRFEDLIAIVALFRPGPMAYIDDYAARKGGEEFEFYGDPVKTRPILEETYGIMVYQEQVMQVAQACAGYSLGGADLLRRAMGKKKPEEMALQRKVFVNGGQVPGAPADAEPVPGAVALGMSAAAAEKLFDDVAAFAGYGFNKSHAAAYAWIGYQTAWLKTHYPAEYLSALMTYYTDKPERLALIKDELDALGVPLLPPDANHSFARFKPEVDRRGRDGLAVRFGLGAIKRVSGAAADLSGERASGGPFTSVEDFYRRVGPRFNKGQLEALSEAGAFDCIAKNRRVACEALGWLAERKSTGPKAQTDLFGGTAALQVPQKVLDVAEWGDVAEREFKSVGFYFSRHPIDSFVPRLTAAGVRRRRSIFSYMLERGLENLEGRRLCAMVDAVSIRVSKKGTTYVEAQVAERDDTYRIYIYENKGRGVTVENVRRVLDGARTSRRPVVFLASLAMDRERTGVFVNGRGVWEIEEFLAGLRGDIVLTIDPAAVPLDRAAAARLREVEEASGQGSPAAAAARAAAVRSAGEKAVAELQDRLDRSARSEEDAARRVRIETPWGKVDLDGRFLISASLETLLRSTPGVTRLEEVLPDQPGQAPAMMARAA